MYFYRTSDGTFWDRIHIPRNTPANQGLWVNQPDYQVVTKVQFDKCVSVMHSVFVLTDRILPGLQQEALVESRQVCLSEYLVFENLYYFAVSFDQFELYCTITTTSSWGVTRDTSNT